MEGNLLNNSRSLTARKGTGIIDGKKAVNNMGMKGYDMRQIKLICKSAKKFKECDECEHNTPHSPKQFCLWKCVKDKENSGCIVVANYGNFGGENDAE